MASHRLHFGIFVTLVLVDARFEIHLITSGLFFALIKTFTIPSDLPDCTNGLGLCDIFGSGCEGFYTAWNRAIRHIYNLQRTLDNILLD